MSNRDIFKNMVDCFYNSIKTENSFDKVHSDKEVRYTFDENQTFNDEARIIFYLKRKTVDDKFLQKFAENHNVKNYRNYNQEVKEDGWILFADNILTGKTRISGEIGDYNAAFFFGFIKETEKGLWQFDLMFEKYYSQTE